MILDFAHNHQISFQDPVKFTRAALIKPRHTLNNGMQYNHQFNRTMIRTILNACTKSNAKPGTRGYAFNSAHVKKDATAKVSNDPSLTSEEKTNIASDLNRLEDHKHPLYVELDPNGKSCVAGGTITTNPPFDGRPVSPEHEESQGVQIHNHPSRGPQFAMPFKDEFTVKVDTKHLSIGPEVASDGSAANAELSKGIEPLKEKIKNKIN